MAEKIGAVRLTRRFQRAYKHKPEDLQQSLTDTIVQLKADPSYRSLRVKKVRGIRWKDVWEASIDMKHRMTFEYDADGGIILRNCNGHEALARP